MYQANVGRFRKGGDTIYLGKDIVGPLDNGNNVKVDKDRDSILLCVKPGYGGL